MSVLTEWYNVLSRYYLLMPPLVSIALCFIDAPFGRFSPSTPSVLLVDGIKAWIAMELVSPLCFITAFLTSPLTRSWTSVKRFPLSPQVIYQMKSLNGISVPIPTPPGILVILYFVHYANRAIISPLRTPVRSKSHIIVPLSAITFNAINGPLLGAFCSALAAPFDKTGIGAPSLRVDKVVQNNAIFWLGVIMWGLGFVGNLWHDEILLNIRRKPTSEGMSSSGPDLKKRKTSQRELSSDKPHYAIPYGGLYKFISYPNYFTEWVEWTGYAIASTALANQLPVGHVVYPFLEGRINLGE
ncbi:hypothetical protein Clacol_002688 [Clathrus columnatus]|uniref:3-oxo-5-alpha-steroid 4-dehydrogenase C-terminal domain-containing protein n=1 Tax=Clathrus columnatus TaxID=1419009 RepID=A0AAV5A991_9AGAM|nr:hypothetical protein Clacol_002688 [Clathrus columnatus]